MMRLGTAGCHQLVAYRFGKGDIQMMAAMQMGDFLTFSKGCKPKKFLAKKGSKPKSVLDEIIQG